MQVMVVQRKIALQEARTIISIKQKVYRLEHDQCVSRSQSFSGDLRSNGAEISLDRSQSFVVAALLTVRLKV